MPARSPPSTTLSRREVVRGGLLASAGLLGAPMIGLGRCRLFGAEFEVSTQAVDLVLGSTVVDMLGLLTLDWARLFRWQREPETFAEEEFRRLEASGVSVFHPAVETSARDPHAGARRWLAGWNTLLSSRPCFLEPIDSITALQRTPRVGKIGVIAGFQNSNHFRTVGDVALFHGLGQRVSQLTYNESNRIGSGGWASRDLGLTGFGAEVIAAMNRVGMVVDISHCGERTSMEAIGVSRKPVLITHSNCRALAPHQRRNKSDAVIRLMASGGGVMGITVVRGFVGGASPDVGDLLAHFDHVARLVGVEHVGLGSDVDVDGTDARGRPSPYYQIRGLDLRRRVFQVADGLLRRGYSSRDVGLMLGGNFVRALADIWSGDPWMPLGESELRRDPFCPAPCRRVQDLGRQQARLGAWRSWGAGCPWPTSSG